MKPSASDPEKMSIILEIEDDESDHTPALSVDDSDSLQEDEIVSVGRQFVAVERTDSDPQPHHSFASIPPDTQRNVSPSSFPNAVVSVLERRNQSGSVFDFEKSLVTSLSPSPVDTGGSATFKKAAILFLKRAPVQSPISDGSGLRQRRGRAGSLVGSEVKNLTEVGLCVVDWKYKNGPLKLPKNEENRPSTSGTILSLAGAESDDDDLSHDERGERNGWNGGDKLNLTIAIKNEKEFRRLLKMLSEFEA